MNDILNKINSTTSLSDINNTLQGLSKKDLKIIANELEIPLLARDKREDVLKKILNYFRACNNGVAFREYM